VAKPLKQCKYAQTAITTR